MDAATKWLIREAYQSGEPAREIALRLDLPESTVNKVLRYLKKACQSFQLTPHEAPIVFRISLVDYDPEWRKELTAKLRTTPLYLDWRRAVLRRDRYRCRECGNTKRVQVDHIYPLSAIIYNYRINSLEEAAECELLWRVDNGRTLCPACHQRTDTHGAKAQRYWVNSDETD